MKKLFYDLETCGVDWKKHSIHQLSAIVEIDGEVVETINLKIRPHPKSQFDQRALEVCQVRKEDLLEYPDMVEQKARFCEVLAKYINKYEKGDCFYLVGFRNTSFDDFFLRKWFELSGDSWFNSYFFSNSLDVSVLATEFLMDQRANMPSFKLHRVALLENQ